MIILSEISQTEKDKSYYYITYMQNFFKKMIQMNIFIKQKQTHRVREQIYGYRGRERGGLDGQFETDMHTLLYLKLNAFP